MCNILTKKKRIMYMAKRRIPKEYRKDIEEKYNTEHECYLAIKNEILSCNNMDERDNLEILFKCDYNSYKRLGKIVDFVVFGLSLLSFIMANISLFLKETNSNSFDAKDIYFTIICSLILLFLVMYSIYKSDSKQKLCQYILEIFNKINSLESQ